MDTVDLAGYGFKQCKHRKFVEQIQGGPKELMPLVRRVHDARFSPQDSAACPEFEAGAAAAVAYAQQHGSAQPLALDLHGFHAPVIPMKRKA